MRNTLKLLLKDIVDESIVETIFKKALEMNLSIKIKKNKGRWHRKTLLKLIKERGNSCTYCQVKGDLEKLTLDHIVPKKILFDMRLEDFYEDESNLEILCSKCNMRKASTLDFNNPKTIILLEKYIKIYKEKLYGNNK